MAQTGDSGKIWLGLCTTTEIALAITLNKYSAALPDFVVLFLWLVPLAMLILWVFKEERSKEFRRHVKETPITYGLMGTFFCAALVFATPVVFKVCFAAKVTKTGIDPSPGIHSALATPAPVTSTPQPMRESATGQSTSATPQPVPTRVQPRPIPPVAVSGQVTQQSQGDCSPNIIGSGNSTSCAPTPKLTASAQKQTPTGNPDRPWETAFTISSNILVATGDLRLKCNGPVLSAAMSRINPGQLIAGSNGPNPNDADELVYRLGPEMLAGGKMVNIVVFSREPVIVLSGSIGPNAIIFPAAQ
jgi:hypothetical protein